MKFSATTDNNNNLTKNKFQIPNLPFNRIIWHKKEILLNFHKNITLK